MEKLFRIAYAFLMITFISYNGSTSDLIIKVGSASDGLVEIAFGITTSDTIKQESGYYFWEVPSLASGTDGCHMTELPAIRNTPIEIPALIDETYTYKVKLPEGMKLVTPSTDLSLNPENAGVLKILI